MSLVTYTKKRNFSKTPEPKEKGKSFSKTLSFVVQRHDASHLHYDFRLELDGVLKSWAVPKGPSLNPGDKRLAVMVEDHPLSYGKFEGVIPEGNYGAGTVEIWDSGTYAPETPSKDPSAVIRKGLKTGSIKFIMNGNKLNGSFALVRLKDGKEKNWLLIKHRDEFAEDSYDIESQNSKRKPTAAKKDSVVRSVRSNNRKLSDYIKPMLATLGDKPFDHEEWIYEIKWDGYRAIAEIDNGKVKLYSRNGLSFNEMYPSITEELSRIKGNVVLDGEIVVLDEKGKPSFQKLQQYGENHSLNLVYYVFDCLTYQGKSIIESSLLERKKTLQKVLPKSDVIRYSDHVERDGVKFFSEIVKTGGLEGMIAKLATSTYRKGYRTTDWLKIKNQNTQEAIIAGFTKPRASRKYFGALILGIYKNGKLNYIGHTGTGFTEKLLSDLHKTFKPLVVLSSPFDTKVPVNAPVTWLKPKLVCNVKFSELTNDGIMRHPVFMGLRMDKEAKEVDHLDKTMKTEKKTSENQKANGNDQILKVDRHEVKLTNQQKVFWPVEGYTKGNVINYYNSISDYILPYLKDRPQSLKRNPNGIVDKGFYHKDAADSAPAWVARTKVVAESTKKVVDYIICNNKATLLYLNNLGCIEINPWNSRVKKPDHPDYLVIDIDPDKNNTFNEVIDVALVIKEIMDKAGASCYCKTSGATGIHVYIPLHAMYSYDRVRSFAELIATLANEQLTKTTTLERSLSKRKGRIYIDYLQNSRGQTLASAYSLRPVPGASVSTPLVWKEVKHGLDPLDFNIKSLTKRLAKTGDLFSGVLKDKNNLKKCIKELGA